MIGLVAALTVIQILHVQRHVTQLIVVGLIVVIALIIPACALLARSFRGGWLDGALWIYWAGELGLAAIMWRLSTGGWFNYALQAVVVRTRVSITCSNLFEIAAGCETARRFSTHAPIARQVRSGDPHAGPGISR